MNGNFAGFSQLGPGETYADPTGYREVTPQGPRSLHFRGKRPILRLPKLASICARPAAAFRDHQARGRQQERDRVAGRHGKAIAREALSAEDDDKGEDDERGEEDEAKGDGREDELSPPPARELAPFRPGVRSPIAVHRGPLDERQRQRRREYLS